MKAWPLVGLIVAIACGGERGNDLFDDPGRSGSGASSGKGSGGSTAGAGTGGKGSGGKAQGGSGGMSKGGTGGVGMATGGSDGGMATGGSGGDGGGVTTGGSGGVTNGGSGGSGATGGSSTAGVGGGVAGAGGRTGSGGSAGTAGRMGSGGTAGAGGAPTPTCEGLEEAYAEALESALACNPDIDSEQCTEHVPASLPCGCVIHVNPANEEALTEMKRLVSEHEKMGCVTVCPALACSELEAICTTSGNGGEGRCVEPDAAK
jgi:hypothetical protein